MEHSDSSAGSIKQDSGKWVCAKCHNLNVHSRTCIVCGEINPDTPEEQYDYSVPAIVRNNQSVQNRSGNWAFSINNIGVYSALTLVLIIIALIFLIVLIASRSTETHTVNHETDKEWEQFEGAVKRGIGNAIRENGK